MSLSCRVITWTTTRNGFSSICIAFHCNLAKMAQIWRFGDERRDRAADWHQPLFLVRAATDEIVIWDGKKHSSCHPAAPPLPHRTPVPEENHVAVMRYPLDFLMKHNIAFRLAPGFSSLSLFFFFLKHNPHTQTGGRINIIQRALQSQTPGNLSALDFKVWVVAYFVLDCCHFVILVPSFFFSPPLPSLAPPPPPAHESVEI